MSSSESNEPFIPFPRRGTGNKPQRQMLPQDLQAEQDVLGGCLLEEIAIIQSVRLLKEVDFYHEHHLKIYKVILALFHRGRSVDWVVVSEELKRLRQLEECGGIDYLLALTKVCSNPQDVSASASTVHDKSILRCLIASAERMSARACQQNPNIYNIKSRFSEEIGAIRDSQPNLGLESVADILRRSEGKSTQVSTGFSALDNLIGGLQPGELTIVSAPPYAGKNAFAVSIALHIALKEKLPVGIFSLSMTRERLVERLVYSLGKIDSHKIHRGRVEPSDWIKTTNSVNSLYQKNIFISDDSDLSVEEIAMQANELSYEWGALGLLVIDNLQMIKMPEIGNVVENIREVMQGVKNIARRTKAPVLLLSNSSLPVEEITEQDQFSHSREVAEAMADTCISIRRSFQKFGPTSEVVDITVAKHRRGKTGAIKLAFQPEYARFGNLIRDYSGGWDE